VKYLAVAAGVAILILGVLYMFNQGNVNQKLAETKGFVRVCVDGVMYIQFPKGASVQYEKNGSIKLCN
jgi:hypothetical protein